MRLVLTSKVEEIEILKRILDGEGITTEVTDGGPLALNSPLMTNLWVVNDSDFSRASALLAHLPNTLSHLRLAWRCPGCEEVLEGQFASCWKCGHERPEGPLRHVEKEPTPRPPSRRQVFANFFAAAVLLLVAAGSAWQLAVGRTHITICQFKAAGRAFDIYLPVLALLTGPLGAATLWRALNLKRQRPARQRI